MFDFDHSIFFLAQDGAAGLPGDTAAAPGTNSGAGTAAPGGGGGAPPASGFGSWFMPVMLGFFLILILVSTMGPRRERKKREAMLSTIKKHDKVQTVGGVVGSIVELKPDYVVLKVDESSNTRITFARSAIQQVISSRTSTSAASPGEIAEIGEVGERT